MESLFGKLSSTNSRILSLIRDDSLVDVVCTDEGKAQVLNAKSFTIPSSPFNLDMFAYMANIDITNISARMLRATAPSITPAITQLFITSGQVPGTGNLHWWCQSLISLLAILSKLLEKHIYFATFRRVFSNL